MKNVQVYNYYNTWLKGFDNKIENLILSHLLRSFVSWSENNNDRPDLWLADFSSRPGLIVDFSSAIRKWILMQELKEHH